MGYAQSRALAQGVNVTFHVRDALAEPLPADFDVILCSLFLHHLDEYKAECLLRSMGQSARRMVLVDDLIRSRWGYLMAWFGCRLLSRSRVVHHDGPVSVQGAFRPNEVVQLARAAGLNGASLTRHWPERYLLTWANHDSLNINS